MAENEVYDVVVVGAGIEGSSTAYQLAKSGKRTILFEQYSLPHKRGSSHGFSRATESSFGPNDYYIPLTIESNKLIKELERECGENLFIKCGWLTFGPKDDPFVLGTENGLKKYGFPYEKFSVEEQRRRYPNLSLPDDYEFLLDKSGGVLRADKILQAYQNQYVRRGGIIRDNEVMVDFTPGEIVSLKTTKGVYLARSIVLTLGPWAAKLLPKFGVYVPLQAVEMTVSYWKDSSLCDFSIDNFPVIFTQSMIGQLGVIPAYDYPGLVKMVHQEGRDTDPDNREQTENQYALDTVKQIIREHFPTLEKEPSFHETCLYTNSPDRDYILDVHPTWKNVVIGAGFSGHGFRLSPVIGKILAQLACGHQPSFDVSHFTIDRFFKK